MIGKDLQLRSVVSTNRAKLLASFQKHSRALEYKQGKKHGVSLTYKVGPPQKNSHRWELVSCKDSYK